MTPALAVLLALLPGAALAQACAPHDAMVRLLAESWGESRQAIALDGAGAVVEIFASVETGTWTMTVTRPGGPTCMVASGGSFELVAEPVVEGDPA